MEMKGKISYDDNYLSQNDFTYVHDYCTTAQYSYGEIDDDGLPPTGMIHEISSNQRIYDLFAQQLSQKCSFLKRMNCHRMYVNCFAPGENPYFHEDGECITFLYYVNMDWDLQNGGETQFYIDGNILGVPAVPNRLVMFDGMIPHRATSFRNGHRFTIAIKYDDNDTSYE